jgi:uncharacterized protein YneF (UPF0154 family)
VSNLASHSWVNWTAVLGIGLCLLALAIVFAVCVGFYVVSKLFCQEQNHRLKKAQILRTSLLAQLRFIEERLTPRSHPLDSFGNELFEPLQTMWMQADLLEPEEMEMVHRLCQILFMLRKKSSLNKKEVNIAKELIHQTYQIFDISQKRRSTASVETPD